MFSYKTKIKLHQTDAAGVLFFADFFTIAHDCYEEFLSQEITTKQILHDQPFIIPVVHAEANYILPLTLSEQIEVRMTHSGSSESSFNLEYQIISERGEIAAEVKTVHAVVNKKTKSKVIIPELIQNLLCTITV